MLQCYGVDRTKTILIRGARQLITLRGAQGARRGPAQHELSIIHDGSVLIRDGVIEEVGPTRRVENLAGAREAVEISAAGRVVMPGFVDCHTHLIFPAPGALDDQHAERSVRARTGKLLHARAQGYLDAMARHGTTTAEAKTSGSADVNLEFKLLRVLRDLRQAPLDLISSFYCRLPEPDETSQKESEAILERVMTEILPRIRRRRLARFADIAWGDRTSIDQYRRYLHAAGELGFGSRIHADQPTADAAVMLAAEQNVVSIDHLEHATGAAVSLLAGSNTMATLLPCAGFRVGGRAAPARALIDAGVPLALATNFNPQHTPALNMQMVVSLACMQMGLTAAEAIVATTINGAHALGCAGRIGSLEPGKWADILVLNISDYRELAYQFGMNLAWLTLKRGACIYEEGTVASRSAATVRPAVLA